MVTEDSDLLAYGVDRVFFKMDPSGNGTEVDLKYLSQCPDYQDRSNPNFTFCKEMLLKACILSGCDYHAGIPSVGYKTALQLVKDHEGSIENLTLALESSGKLKNRDEYLELFKKAYLTFKCQIVYDPR